MTRFLRRLLPILPAVAVVLWALALQAFMITRQNLNMDELEHLHAGFSLFHGLIPYRDFFENHMPLLFYVLAALMKAVPWNLDGVEALPVIAAARALQWGVSVALAATVWALGRRALGRQAAWVALALLFSTQMFLLKSVEIRPDAWASLCVLASVWGLMKAMSVPAPERGRLPRMLFVAGVCLGLSLLWSPKAVYAFPGFVVWGAAMLSAQGGWKNLDWRLAGAFAAGVILPGGLLSAYYGAAGIWPSFWTSVIEWNLRWRSHFPGSYFVKAFLHENPGHALLAAGGTGLLLADAVRRRFDPKRLGLLAVGSSLWIGLWGMRLPYSQYFLFLLPFASLLGAAALVRLARVMQRRWPLFERRTTAWIMGGVLVVLAGPILAARAQWETDNYPIQVELIRYIQQETAPQDTVLDGWTGLGVFRPHALFYSYLNHEIQAMIPEAQKAQMVQDLVEGRVRPELIILDRDGRRFLQDVLPWVSAHYHAEVGNFIWRRNRPDRSRG